MPEAETAARLAQVRRSTADLLSWLDDLALSDDDVRAASLLPDWTRGHVLTHIARNADGVTRTVGGALNGELRARYPGQNRAAGIAAGAGRPATELVADLRESATQLDVVLASAESSGGWWLPSTEGRSAGDWLARRWREVEIHRVDLDLGYGPDRWPGEFVDYLLPELVATLPGRAPGTLTLAIEQAESVGGILSGRTVVAEGAADRHDAVSGPDWAVLAWLLGRPAAAGPVADAPELAPWL